MPASTLGPSSYGSPEISVISYKTEDTEWNTTRPTDVGDYKAEYNVNGGENYGAPTSLKIRSNQVVIKRKIWATRSF